MVGLIVHGGAWDIPEDMVPAHEEGCRRAVEVGYSILEEGRGALDAAVAAVRLMEDDPTFDAGIGSFLGRDGGVELDAAVMTGRELRAGSIASVRRIRNPVEVARRLLEVGDPVLLVGEGAEEFAESQGIALCSPSELILPREVERWKVLRQAGGDATASFGRTPSDTVGAVALDGTGEVAVAVSTGGRPLKPPGRVGDSPVLGAGLAAELPLGGVCSTGLGEGILRVTMARRALERFAAAPARIGCRTAVDFLTRRVRARGGLIAIKPPMELGYAFSTPRMAIGYRTRGMAAPEVRVPRSRGEVVFGP